jgi:hypothetical protein
LALEEGIGKDARFWKLARELRLAAAIFWYDRKAGFREWWHDRMMVEGTSHVRDAARVEVSGAKAGLELPAAFHQRETHLGLDSLL